MPKKGEYDTTYVDRLKDETGIILLEPFKGSRAHHLMKCGTCGHEFTATPISKFQNKRKYPNSNGCPKCQRDKEDEKYAEKRATVLKTLKENNLEVLTLNYKGQRKTVYEKVRVRNTVCGHEFDLCISNYLYGLHTTNCTVCGIRERAQQLTQTSIGRHQEWLKTASEWQVYKYCVELLTKKTYNKYKDIINPSNLPRGVAGGDGNYHLDHVISRRYCFENNIPPELCAHQDNLRLIPWQENIAKSHYIITDIPKIFSNYITNASIEVDAEESDTVEETIIFNEIDCDGENYV